jgi:hypothetical protein
MIKARHFKIHELVPPKIYTLRGEKAWELIDIKLIILIDAMRDEFGSATINNYFTGGDRQWSGLRTSESPHYSPTSQHSFGRAADLIFKDVTAEQVRQSMLANRVKWNTIVPSITLEQDVSWVHVDVRNGEPGIALVRG